MQRRDWPSAGYFRAWVFIQPIKPPLRRRFRLPQIDVRSWESFEKKLKEIRQAELSAKRTADFLFRGLSDSPQAWRRHSCPPVLSPPAYPGCAACDAGSALHRARIL